jgi:hypothetical protein
VSSHVNDVDQYFPENRKIIKMKVVFTGGLCNFTQKITHDFGTETKYQNDPKANKVNSVISQLQDIQNEIYKSKDTPITGLTMM